MSPTDPGWDPTTAGDRVDVLAAGASLWAAASVAALLRAELGPGAVVAADPQPAKTSSAATDAMVRSPRIDSSCCRTARLDCRPS
ncbi:MAG TPA: hypothetical protein VIV06_09825, partial [Candidatus Limnocylindrales bacterium]